MNQRLKSTLFLLLTAVIWGFAFVAQRQGMKFLDPMLFNGIRFTLGTACIGIMLFNSPGSKSFPILPGLVLFVAASLQQVGMVATTAGNAGFITGLYVVFIPVFGVFFHQKVRLNSGIAVLLSLVGTYFISVTWPVVLNWGDVAVLGSAIFWAMHVRLINRYVKMHEGNWIAFSQYLICAVLSLFTGLMFHLLQPGAQEWIQLLGSQIARCWLPILYGGILSVGLAYTLQIHGQRHTDPVTSALILCLESVFAMLGGWWLLGEHVDVRKLVGAGLMFAAMILSIISLPKKEGRPESLP